MNNLNLQCRVVTTCLMLLFFCTKTHSQAHTITSFSPANAASNETVTIIGTNFSAITGVSFGGVTASSFTVVSTTRITAVVGAGASGTITVTKTAQPNATAAGFTYSSIPTVTRMITDFGGYWSTNTTTTSSIYPNDGHNLMAFTYGGVTYATGVNNASLSDHGIAYTSSTFKALPAIMNGTTSGASLFIVAASKMDGNTGAALYTHPAIKDLTIQSVLSDGINGLNLGTGYTNLPVGATSNFLINSIQVSKATDAEPDLVITQIADPSSSAFDTYKFLDASNNVVGNQLQIDLSKLAPLGNYYLDLYTVTNGVAFSGAKPTGANSTNTTRQIRLMAFKLSDFGINASNYSQVKSLQIVPSGVTDMAFVAYNTSAINVPPSIAQDLSASSLAICNPGGGSARLTVNATAAAGGALSYSWEQSTDGGSSWSAVTDGGIFSGATTASLAISTATVNHQYKATVTEAGSGYSATSNVFTITAIASTTLSGTLDPASFNNCLNSASGTTSLTVSPSGGTGAYSYQWSSSATAGGTYTDLPGAIYNSYSPSLATTGTKYYKVLITSGCNSRLSNSAQVVISGADISSVTNGAACSTGTVNLSATATGGTLNWYAAASGGSSLATGATFTTPPISATTTYYVGTTLSGCNSSRQPVVASIINTISLSSSNFSVTYAQNICSGSGSNIVLATSGLIDGTYQITYNVTGANTVTGATAAIQVSGGAASFTTLPLTNAGASTITITGVQVGGCTITPSSGNTAGFTVNAASPSVSHFSVSVANGCSNDGSTATVTSSSLASGTYIMTYNITGSNTLNAVTSQMVFTGGTPGSGTFKLPVLSNTGNNTVTATAIALLSSPDCSSTLAATSPAFESNFAATLDAGTPETMCAADISANITGGSVAENYTALLWSTSNGSGSFSNNNTASALSATTYTPSAADVSRGWAYMTLTATPASGCAAVSKTITLTIHPLVSGGTVSDDQTVAPGTQPASLTISGNTGNVVKWQKATDASFGSAIDIVNTTTTLSSAAIGPLNTTTYFRAICQSGACNPVASAHATITVSSIMPVKLLYFTYTCGDKKPLLQWATAQEFNNDRFEIEGSSNGSAWTRLKTIPGAGNSAINHTYAFRDDAVHGFQYYYRLKQIDFDGTATYSPVIKTTCGQDGTSIRVSPNPSKSFFALTNMPPNGYLRVTDMSGREIMPKTTYRGSSFHINLSHVVSGMYIVVITSEGKTETKQLLKQ